MRGRIRSIKPEAFCDEKLWDLDAAHPGLHIFRSFTGLWCQADRDGRFEWKPRELRVFILPYWEGDFSRTLSALAEAGFIRSYEVAGRRYGEVVNFKRHQYINQREAKSSLPASPHVPAQDVPSGFNVPPELRATVLDRDSHRCVKCGSIENLSMDHILPQSAGGIHIVENLRTLCKSCNSKRPVQGEALERELAADGFSYSALRRMCLHVQDDDGTIPSLPFPSLPNPVPIPPTRARDPVDLESALAIPIAERAALVLRNPAHGNFLRPAEWPEVVEVVGSWCTATGTRGRRHGALPGDTGLMCVLARLAEGHPVEDLVRAGTAAATDPYLSGRKSGLASFTAEVLSRLLSTKTPQRQRKGDNPYQPGKREGVKSVFRNPEHDR